MHDIEYLLRFLLNSTTLTIDRVSEIEGATMDLLPFVKTFQGSKIVRGFMRVGNTGHFEVPMFGAPIDPAERKHRLVYCHLAVGTPVYASMEYATSCSPPNGFDSFIVRRDGIDIAAVIPDLEKTEDLRNYSYVLSDRSRVLSIAEVHFTYDRELEERSRNSNICENCKTAPAVSFCLAERASFCDHCDNAFHDNEFTQRHQRYYFDQVGKKKFIHCEHHPSSVVDYFCTDCALPLCTQCRISGSHAAAPKNTHALMTYIDACNHLAREVALKDAATLEKERAVAAVSDAVIRYLKDFQDNIAEIKAKIDLEYSTAVSDLNDLVRRRYQLINARYLEALYLKTMLRQAQEYPRAADPSVLVSKWGSINDLAEAIRAIKVEGDAPDRKKLLLKGSLAVSLQTTDDDFVTVIGSTYDEDTARKRTDLLFNATRYTMKSRPCQ